MSEPPRFFPNERAAGFQAGASEETRVPLDFHQRLPGYAPTPLLEVPELARALGIGAVLVKNEASRLGLPAFKILGASWAIYRALEKHAGQSLEPWRTLDELRARLVPLRPLALATATDGNHGRAVAHMARLLDLTARIFVPEGTAPARIEAIASEGAQVEIVRGTYDDAVARAAEEASASCLVISDTSWPGYEEVPRWVMEGYSTIFAEIEQALAARGGAPPELVAIQFGVGALAAAVVRHDWAARPKILSVEPLHAACALASMEAGEMVTVPGPHDSIMAGLNCGRPSLVAWPIVSEGIDAFIAIADERAREAMRALARARLVAGETGAAGLAGLLELLSGAESARYREALEVTEKTRALILVTEGATDPVGYAEVVRGTEGTEET